MWKTILGIGGVILLCLSQSAWAHFGMVIPSSSMVMEQKDAKVSLEMSFSHPMDMVGMDMARPESVVVVDAEGQSEPLALEPGQVMGHQAWKAVYQVKKPGVYQVVMEPQAYWEPAEDCFIIHYTKTYLAAFGAEEGWDRPVGLKTEIIPLTRPFGNYAGNAFQGRVMLDGQPVPGAEVEVEYYNQGNKRQAPNDYLVTQALRADRDGVFTYVAPWAGWWGFSALNTDKDTREHDGQAKPVEIGAVLWLEFIKPVQAK